MRVIGIDAGSARHAFCVLDVTDTRGGILSAIGFIEGEPHVQIPTLFKVFAKDGKVLGIERPAGIGFKGAGGQAAVPHLLQTTEHAGGMRSIARSLGVKAVCFTAADWRREVLGKGSATDQDVAVAIPRLIPNWPKRSNNHVRDAAGAALYVGWLAIKEAI
jgi:Holliday junction resolvasome RuvABC endonuclease subunit